MSIDTLSLPALRLRLRSVIAGACHLRGRLPPENPHNCILRLSDVERYIGLTHRCVLGPFCVDAPPKACQLGCASVDVCRARQRCRNITPEIQRKLSEFFMSWERGDLLKANIGGTWRVLPARDAALAQMAAPALEKAPARRMSIDLTQLGPRLKV